MHTRIHYRLISILTIAFCLLAGCEDKPEESIADQLKDTTGKIETAIENASDALEDPCKEGMDGKDMGC